MYILFTIANEISNVTFSVMPTCSASFFKKDSRQAGMTTLKSYVNLLNAFVLITARYIMYGIIFVELKRYIDTKLSNLFKFEFM